MTRAGDAADRSSAIRTFLIADIRGYTAFTDQRGDEAASRLATTFAQIVAEAMEAWGGQLVELRGDEALCTFDSPRAALRCAMELQQTFAEEAAASPDLPLRVGMGLDDAATGSVRVTLPSRGESILAASFRPGSDEVAAASSAGGLRIHRTQPTGGDLGLAGRQPVDVGVTADHVVVSLAGVGAAVFDRTDGTELHSRDFEVDDRTHAHVAKDVGRVAGVYENASTGLIEAATLRDAARLPGCVAPAGMSPDGEYAVLAPSRGLAAVCAGDNLAGVYDVVSESFAVEYGSEVLVHGAVSGPRGSGGRLAAIAAYEDASGVGRADVWDLGSAALIASIDAESRPGFLPTFVSFSPDGAFLAVGENGPRAVVFDVAALAEGADAADAIVFDREVHTARAPKAIVIDDGVLATASGDGVYRFWDVETGEMTMQLETTGLIGTGMFDFSPDFASFYYEDAGGIIRRMPMEVDEMIDLAGSLVTRSLTDAECREYLHVDACDEAGD